MARKRETSEDPVAPEVIYEQKGLLSILLLLDWVLVGTLLPSPAYASCCLALGSTLKGKFRTLNPLGELFPRRKI